MVKIFIFLFNRKGVHLIVNETCIYIWHLLVIWIRRSVLHVTFLVVIFTVLTNVSQVIVGHGEPAPRLCNKDPFALKSLSYLSRIFPKAKFVLMLRDGRATVHSMISRKVCWVSFSYQGCRQTNFLTGSCFLTTTWQVCTGSTSILWSRPVVIGLLCLSYLSASIHRSPSLASTWPATGTVWPSGAVRWRPCSASARQLGSPDVCPSAMSSSSSTQRRKWGSCFTSWSCSGTHQCCTMKSWLERLVACLSPSEYLKCVCGCVGGCQTYLFAPVVSSHADSFSFMCWGFTYFLERQADFKFFKCVLKSKFFHFYCGGGRPF